MTDQTAIIDAPAAIEFAVAGVRQELTAVESLALRAVSINRHLDLITKADSNGIRHRLRAGQELAAARPFVPEGKWRAWCKDNIKRSYRDIKRLLKIAGAKDPEAALEQERASRRASDARRQGTRSCPPEGDPVDEHPRTPASLFTVIKSSLDAMPTADVREFSKMLTDYIIGRPEPKVGALAA